MFRNSYLYSVLFLKCPRCREGNLLERHPYHLSNFNKVKQKCSQCNLKYAIEPSFFTGSMYVSYAVGVAIAVTVYVLTLIMNLKLGPTAILISITITLFILTPYIGAVSKSIWAHFFLKYDKSLVQKHKSKSNDSGA
ncbi:DUF983 domain-containing protein [Flavobacteriaceae bacterium R38]|nr:DUF983 domain-containing protein [Flavobacteriaceae bacterium R38]